MIKTPSQILTTKVEPRPVRENVLIMAVDPYHRYSNEPADFKLKKTFWSPWFKQKYFSASRVKGLFLPFDIARSVGIIFLLTLLDISKMICGLR